MPESVHRLADRVLRIVYDLQFVGRVIAVLDHWDANGNGILKQASKDREPVRFESIPILILLAELYRPAHDNEKLKCALRPAVKYLESKGTIRAWHSTPLTNFGAGDGFAQ